MSALCSAQPDHLYLTALPGRYKGGEGLRNWRGGDASSGWNDCDSTPESSRGCYSSLPSIRFPGSWRTTKVTLICSSASPERTGGFSRCFLWCSPISICLHFHLYCLPPHSLSSALPIFPFHPPPPVTRSQRGWSGRHRWAESQDVLGAVWEGDREALWTGCLNQRGPSGPPQCVWFSFLFPLKHFTLKGSQAQVKRVGVNSGTQSKCLWTWAESSEVLSCFRSGAGRRLGNPWFLIGS